MQRLDLFEGHQLGPPSGRRLKHFINSLSISLTVHPSAHSHTHLSFLPSSMYESPLWASPSLFWWGGYGNVWTCPSLSRALYDLMGRLL